MPALTAKTCAGAGNFANSACACCRNACAAMASRCSAVRCSRASFKPAATSGGAASAFTFGESVAESRKRPMR